MPLCKLKTNISASSSQPDTVELHNNVMETVIGMEFYIFIFSTHNYYFE